MATQTTGGGSTTSFTNTPQATADSYSFLEQTLLDDATLYNVATKTVYLDVLANDLGGNAKSLFSIEDGSGALTDLLTSNVATGWEQTQDGNWIRICGGKIEFKIGDGSGDIANARDVNSLGGDEVIDDTFLYAIRLANGTIAYSTVHITIAGENDAVVLGAVTDATITDTAADDTFGDISGTLTSTDPDLNDTPTYGLADSVASDDAAYDVMKVTDYGTLYLNTTTGAYKFVPDGEAIQGLDSDDANVLLDFEVSVTDGDTTDTDTLTITLDGANDVVELDAATDATITDTAADDTFDNVTGSLVGHDRDDGETLTYGLDDSEASDDAAYDVMKVTDYGTLYLNITSGAYKFVPDADAIQALDSDDANVLLDFGVSVTDSDTTDSDTLTITIDGSNDAVELAAVTGSTVTDTAANDTFSDIDGSLVGSDRDAGETLEYSLDDAGVVASDLVGYDQMKVTSYGTLYLNATSGAYKFVANDTAVEGLDSDDANVVLDFAVSVSDGDTSDGDTLTITIDGAEDPAEITGDDAKSITEDAVPNTVSGDLNSTDRDADDADDSWQAGTIVSANGYGSLHINADGTWTYTLDNSNATVDGLDDASTPLTDTFTVQTADGTAHDIVITINGNTDATDVLAPTDIKFNLASTVGALTGNSLAANSTLGSLTAVDGDSASWTFALSGTNAGLFTISPASGGSVNLLTGAAAIATGNYTIDVTATDGGGNSYVETFTVSVGSSGGDLAVSFTVSNDSDVSFGLNGIDTINGGNGDDALVGGQNSDSLNGGLGNDQLFGGQGNDTFVFNTAISPTANVDSILDFDAAGTPNSDKINLDDAIFVGLTAGNLAANFQSSATGTFSGTAMLQYNSTTGELWYDADGAAGGTAAVLFAKLTVVGGAVDASDFAVI